MVPCYFSDHRAIHFQGVLGKGFPPCPGSWKLNCALLEREEIVEELRGAYKMWKLDKVYFPTVAQWWEFMKVKFRSFFQAKGRCQECERRSELRRLQKKLHSLQDLQLCGWDVRKEVDETKEGLKRHFEEESRRIIFRSKVEHLEKGEKCNSFFFRELHSAHTPLIELRDRDGRIQEGKEGVMKVVTDFYRDLYSPKDTDTDQADSSCQILAKVLANRLKRFIGQIVHPDQTCGIPGCRIADNLALIRDAVH
ncbi:uncharacterized protein WCC33_003552 [Rhinophrynus dorsalis]